MRQLPKLLAISLISIAYTQAPITWADTTSQGTSDGTVPVQKVEALKAPGSVEQASSSGGSLTTPIERAKGEKLATAMGHYGRARALLISAIREFDKGMELVDPNALLDTRLWRETVLERADEIARVLDPQPRATKTGIRFGNETRGVGDAGKR